MNTSWIAVTVVNLLGLAPGAILGYAPCHFTVKGDPAVEKTDEILPQSQCGQCSHPGCRPYVETVSCDGEKISRCAPGGEVVVLKVAESPNVESQPLDGEASKLAPARMVAAINENNCIGCTKCIQACPVDAITGATRAVHTVMSDLCTGCNLCADPCLTYCTSLQPVAETPNSWKWDLGTISVHIIPVEHHV